MKAVRLALAAACVLGVALAARAEDKKDDKKDSIKDKLVGKWEMAKGKGLPTGAVVEFMKDGKMTITAKRGDKEIKINGKYTVDGSKFKMTLTTPSGDEKSQTVTVSKIDDKVMETKDEMGDEANFKKVK